ncbi:MAG: hypothetical protein K2G29_07300, partial [Muribaculaceae bacterium]|nr:hypothetical protein [Muribaculaceae bacterium]
MKHILSFFLLLMAVITGYSQSFAISNSSGINDKHIHLTDYNPDNQREYIPYRHIVSTPVLPDSADIRHHERKAFWRAGAETVGFNISLWAFDRYVLKGHYAYI